jgi:hypothetical protein
MMEARIADLEGMLAVAGFVLLLVGALLTMLPINTCDPNCERCMRYRAEDDPRCPMCFRRHDPKERCR